MLLSLRLEAHALTLPLMTSPDSSSCSALNNNFLRCSALLSFEASIFLYKVGLCYIAQI